MNHQPKPGIADEEQASLWAARLDGGALSPADRAELDAWLAADSGHAALLARYTDLSAELDLAVPELAAVGLLPRATAPGHGTTWAPWKLALGGLAAAVLVAGLWIARSVPRPEAISAPAGERRTFTLADGSRVELNANTSVLVENGRGERRVRLANGEAFFEVSKDKTRPFIVETPAGSVRVTGTKFSVLTESPSQLDVTVLEGSVQVRHGADAATQAAGFVKLSHGDQLVTEADGGIRLNALSDDDLEDALAWRQGQIVCNGLTLSTVLARFAHYHGKVITATPGAAALHPGSRYNLENLEAFLADLPRGVKAHATHEPDGSIRVSLLGEP